MFSSLTSAVKTNISRSAGMQHALGNSWWRSSWGSPWGTTYKTKWSKKYRVLVLTTSFCFSSSCHLTTKFTFFFFFVNYSIFHCCYLLKITENPWWHRTWWGYVLRVRSESTWASDKILTHFSRRSKPIKFGKSFAWVSAE